MSDFLTLAPAVQGNPGNAPRIFVAATNDDAAAVTAVGYLNDLDDKVKENDVFFVQEDLAGTPTLARYRVAVAGSDKSLVAFA